ncbi:MAG: discoidin domain-containing protein [Coriobacteriales bacterium]|nr:discoidin domain-containing protein [Coriobacteriales bacterium]
MSSSNYCPKCGARLREGVRFCTSCGATLEETGKADAVQPAAQAPRPAAQAPQPAASRAHMASPAATPKSNPTPKRGLTLGHYVAIGAAIGLFVIAMFAVVKIVINSASSGTSGTQDAQAAATSGTQDKDVAAEQAQDASAKDASTKDETVAGKSKDEDKEDELEQTEPPVFDDEPEASSVLPPDQYTSYYGPKNAIDGNIRTAWNDGGSGVGEWISLEAKSDQVVKGLRIVGGYPKREDVYYKNYRPKDVTIELSDGYTQQVTLKDAMGEWQEFEFDKPHKTDYIKVTIDSVYGSNKYDDAAIAELEAF